ncbi:MAG: hypothetical protein N2112_11970 [Gemmataceae bacterium]|nr:hypothetical protein [Gemmataceae bacterium]
MAEQPNNTNQPVENTGTQTTETITPPHKPEGPNPLAVVFQQIWSVINTRTSYYVIGTVALLVAIFLFWNWFSSSRDLASSVASRALDRADTIESLTSLEQQYAKEPTGMIARFHHLRYLLYTEGLSKVGTFSSQEQEAAIKSIAEARKLALELVKDLSNNKKEKGQLQAAYVEAARAEKALIGSPIETGTPEQAAKYFEEAAKIFPDSELAKTYTKEAAELRANAAQIEAVQRVLYASIRQPNQPEPKTGGGGGTTIPGITNPNKKDEGLLIPGLK